MVQSGAPPAAGGPSGYVRADGISSVVYTGNDLHIYEIFLLGDGWHFGDLTAQAGG